jgi:acyl carrier protein
VTRDEIERRLIDIVRKEKNIDEAQLKPEMLLEEAGIDSLDSLTILFAIEEEFGISVPDDRARALKTVGDMMDVVADGLRIED